jgi:mRNA interferase MazF
MVEVRQGEVWWADMAEPIGSEPGFHRPVVVVQCDSFNLGSIKTVVCVSLTSNLKWARAPGNVVLSAKSTGLPKDSVANVSQISTLDRQQLTEHIGKLPASQLRLILDGIDIVLCR